MRTRRKTLSLAAPGGLGIGSLAMRQYKFPPFLVDSAMFLYLALLVFVGARHPRFEWWLRSAFRRNSMTLLLLMVSGGAILRAGSGAFWYWSIQRSFLARALHVTEEEKLGGVGGAINRDSGKKPNAKERVSQNMVNSPGGIQAGRDVNINTDPPRQVTKGQANRFMARLAGQYRGKVQFQVAAGDQEAMNSAAILQQLLTDASFDVEPYVIPAMMSFAGGPPSAGMMMGSRNRNAPPHLEPLRKAGREMGLDPMNWSSTAGANDVVMIAVLQKPRKF